MVPCLYSRRCDRWYSMTWRFDRVPDDRWWVGLHARRVQKDSFVFEEMYCQLSMLIPCMLLLEGTGKRPMRPQANVPSLSWMNLTIMRLHHQLASAYIRNFTSNIYNLWLELFFVMMERWLLLKIIIILIQYCANL